MKAYREKLTHAVAEELEPLTVSHGVEAKFPMAVEMDWNMYMLMQEHGNFFLVSARDHGFLVGYAFVVVVPHPHFRGVMFADVTGIYVIETARASGIGSSILGIVEEEAAKVADYLTINGSHGHDIEPMALRFGFENIQTTFGKKVGA